MLENNNEVLLSMISKGMSFLLDAKERQEEEEFRKTGPAHPSAAILSEVCAEPAQWKTRRNYSCLLRLANFVYSPSQARLTGPYRAVSLFCNDNLRLLLKF